MTQISCSRLISFYPTNVPYAHNLTIEECARVSWKKLCLRQLVRENVSKTLPNSSATSCYPLQSQSPRAVFYVAVFAIRQCAEWASTSVIKTASTWYIVITLLPINHGVIISLLNALSTSARLALSHTHIISISEPGTLPVYSYSYIEIRSRWINPRFSSTCSGYTLLVWIRPICQVEDLFQQKGRNSVQKSTSVVFWQQDKTAQKITNK